MKTIEYKLATFDELTDEQRAKALEHHHDWNVDGEWWDSIYDDAKTVADLMGLEIDQIFFRGFCSQGDGACFEGTIRPAKGIVAAVKAYAPQDTELHAIATEIAELQRIAFYTASATVTQSGHYHHERSMSVEVDYERGKADEDAWKDWCSDFALWIYKRLESEYEFLTSDEAVAESLRANEVEFEIEEDGDIRF
jgi:hypothetical protein